MQSHNGWNGTTLEPHLLWLYNTFILDVFSRLFSVILSLAILHYQKGAWSQSPPDLVVGAKRNQEEYIDRFYFNSQQFSNNLNCY
jgi:hypothetical protein